MKKLLKRNYDAVVKRGLIKQDTYNYEFLGKLKEEVIEVEDSRTSSLLYEEIGDVIIVCTNWLIHRGIDIEKLLTEIAEKNERRAK